MNIRLENFRSFVDTGLISMADLNVYVGKNSSGKSSILRYFPLMKQTLQNSTREPILWYSPDYVDFGEYEDVLGHDKSKPIKFTFDFNLPSSILFEAFINSNYHLFNDSFAPRDYRKKVQDLPISVSVSIHEDYISEIIIKLLEVEICVSIRSDKFVGQMSVNKKNIYRHSSKKNQMRISASQGIKSLLPVLTYELLDSSKQKKDDSTLIPGFRDLNRDEASRKIYFLNKATDILEEYSKVCGEIFDIDKEALEKLLFETPLELDRKSMQRKLQTRKAITIQTKNTLTPSYGNNKVKEHKDMVLTMLVDLHIASYINTLLFASENYISLYFSQVVYIAPLRATAQRYYRLQGIAVSEMDASGANIPMIIANMSEENLYKFQEWTKENFGFKVDRKPISGHISVLINFEEAKESSRNIVDLGFGYSQLLPLIVAIWNTLNKEERYNFFFSSSQLSVNHTIVIEQPELHLHPAMQSLFVNVCAQIANNNSKKDNKKIVFVIETHSETIINALSDLVNENEISADKVLINLVNINEDNVSSVKTLNFDLDGDLEEWPIGFFSPGMELL